MTTIKEDIERLNKLLQWHDEEKYMNPIAHDAVNAPKHYILSDGLEVKDVREAICNKLQREGIVVPYADFSDWERAWEYLTRAWFKNGKEDIEKAQYYIDRLVDRMQSRGRDES